MKRHSGFTIVELLIVIVVIGILAAITIVAFNGVQNRARAQTVNSDLTMLNKAIHAARINNDQTLFAVTGSNCTHCFDQARYELTLDRIGAAAGMNLSGLKAGDPWGEKYNIDENEGEGATPCDTLDGIGVRSSHPGVTGIKAQIVSFYSCPPL